MLIGTFYYLGSRPYNSINFFRLKYGKLLCNLFCYVNMYLQGIINVVIWQIFTRTHILKRIPSHGLLLIRLYHGHLLWSIYIFIEDDIYHYGKIVRGFLTLIDTK